jgi:hypothetical protein
MATETSPQTEDHTMHFSREAWDRNAALYEIIRTMPFNAELATGTLTEARFKHYITQDAHYLVGTSLGRGLPNEVPYQWPDTQHGHR